MLTMDLSSSIWSVQEPIQAHWVELVSCVAKAISDCLGFGWVRVYLCTVGVLVVGHDSSPSCYLAPGDMPSREVLSSHGANDQPSVIGAENSATEQGTVYPFHLHLSFPFRAHSHCRVLWSPKAYGPPMTKLNSLCSWNTSQGGVDACVVGQVVGKENVDPTPTQRSLRKPTAKKASTLFLLRTLYFCALQIACSFLVRMSGTLKLLWSSCAPILTLPSRWPPPDSLSCAPMHWRNRWLCHRFDMFSKWMRCSKTEC